MCDLVWFGTCILCVCLIGKRCGAWRVARWTLVERIYMREGLEGLQMCRVALDRAMLTGGNRPMSRAFRLMFFRLFNQPPVHQNEQSSCINCSLAHWSTNHTTYK